MKFNFNKDNIELNIRFDSTDELEKYLMTIMENFEGEELCLLDKHKQLLLHLKK